MPANQMIVNDPTDSTRLRRTKMPFCRIADANKIFLNRIVELVTLHGRTNLENDLGANAGDLVDAYDAAVASLAILDPDYVVPDLPV